MGKPLRAELANGELSSAVTDIQINRVEEEIKYRVFTADKQLSDGRDIRHGEPRRAAKMRLLLLLLLLLGN